MRDVLKRRSVIVTMALLCVATAVSYSAVELSTGPINSTASIHVEEYVRIGGIDQWITITGSDRRNPVILFLHGGPGSSASPFAAHEFAGWEKDFTLAQWDQRGAGRTYARNGKAIEATMTVERMTEDGIEVAEYLRKYLHKRKIILFGGSWGSILGIRMAHARPDLFYAWVGAAQATNWQQDLAGSYAWVLQIAQSKGDQANLDALKALGAPPWDSIDKWLSYMKVLNLYQTKLATAPMQSSGVLPQEYQADLKSGKWQEANTFSFHHFWGPTLSGPLTRVDLTSLTDFKIPIFFIKGEWDLICPPKLTRAYFDRIHAPSKKFYLVPDSGHNLSLRELNFIRKVLLTEVRPIAR